MAALNAYFTEEGVGTVLFPFLSMTGALQPTRVQFERVIYPGVNGIGIWSTGTRGEPFSVTTEADAANAAGAATLIAAYLSTISGTLDLYRAGISYGTVLVHNVIEERVKQLGRTIGGNVVSSGSSSFLVVCQWTLEGVV